MAAKIQSPSDIIFTTNLQIGESGSPKVLTCHGNIDFKADADLQRLDVDSGALEVDDVNHVAKTKTLRVNADNGGETGSNTLSNGAEKTVSTGTGAIKLTGTGTTQDSAGFLKFYVDTTAIYVPYFSNHVGS